MGRLEALLLWCRAGDEEALEELIRRWERKVFYYVGRLVAEESDAWDVLQQTWVRVLKGVAKIKDAEKPVPWLYRVGEIRASRIANRCWHRNDGSIVRPSSSIWQASKFWKRIGRRRKFIADWRSFQCILLGFSHPKHFETACAEVGHSRGIPPQVSASYAPRTVRT